MTRPGPGSRSGSAGAVGVGGSAEVDDEGAVVGDGGEGGADGGDGGESVQGVAVGEDVVELDPGAVAG